MYRVLLSRTGVAYAKECDDELDEFDFVEVLRDFVDSGDVIVTGKQHLLYEIGRAHV